MRPILPLLLLSAACSTPFEANGVSPTAFDDEANVGFVTGELDSVAFAEGVDEEAPEGSGDVADPTDPIGEAARGYRITALTWPDEGGTHQLYRDGSPEIAGMARVVSDAPSVGHIELDIATVTEDGAVNELHSWQPVSVEDGLWWLRWDDSIQPFDAQGSEEELVLTINGSGGSGDWYGPTELAMRAIRPDEQIIRGHFQGVSVFYGDMAVEYNRCLPSLEGSGSVRHEFTIDIDENQRYSMVTGDVFFDDDLCTVLMTDETTVQSGQVDQEEDRFTMFYMDDNGPGGAVDFYVERPLNGDLELVAAQSGSETGAPDRLVIRRYDEE